MVPPLIRQLIIAAVSLIVPFVYSLIINVAPGIPISAEQFLQLALFIVSAIIGGGAMAMASDKFVSSQFAFERTRFNNFMIFILPAVLYAALIIPGVAYFFAPLN